MPVYPRPMGAWSELMIDLAVQEGNAGRFAAASALLRSVLGASGRDAFVLYGMGHMAYRAGDHAAAVRLLHQSLAIDPANAKAQNDLGLALFAIGDAQAGFAALMRAWTMDEALALAVMTDGMELLRDGDFAAGWPRYEARLVARPGIRPRRDFVEPRWLGEADIAGKTILLHCEQGYGDAIQFVRYVPHVAALGATVLLEGHRALMPLLRDIHGVAATIVLNERLPRFDLHCPVMSLPLAFRTMPPSIPAAIPYLHASAEGIAEWRRYLGAPTKRRIGIAWSGNAANEADHDRTIALEALLPVLSVPSVEFHVVQTEIRPADRGVLDRLPAVRDHSAMLAATGDFAATAALISVLDLVIAVDTSVAHLAGALGKPVWLLLPHVPDWRWMAGRQDSPWYPSMCLFRQAVPGDWHDVIATVRSRLALA